MTTEEMATQYASEISSSTFKKAITDAYIKGYREGILASTGSITVDELEYVDLGLPSGTLWSARPLSKDVYELFSQHEAQNYQLPSEEQVHELIKNTKFYGQIDSNFCELLGPSGEHISLKGWYIDETCVEIWIKGTPDEYNEAPLLSISRKHGEADIRQEFTGYKHQILLVKNKDEI